MSRLPKKIACYNDCNRCSLGKRSLHRTLYRGDFPSPVLIIGEAPGEDEDNLAEPLVGRSGQVWWPVIKQAIEMSRSSLSIEDFAATNLVACVPWNDSKTVFSKYRQPSLPEIEACRDRLIDTMRLANPKAIITIGTVAKTNCLKVYKKVWKKGSLPAILNVSHPAHWARRGGSESLDGHKARQAICQFLLKEKTWLNAKPILLVPEPLEEKPNRLLSRSGKVLKKTGLRILR